MKKQSVQPSFSNKSNKKSNKNRKKLVATGGRAVEARASGELNRFNQHAAGVDIGGDRHYVAVPPGSGGSSESSVREFGVFTKDLYSIAEWLRDCGVETVAMESTGVYWVPLFEVLEERGFKVKLVDARKVRNVSGRKSDVLDCQWLQQLESYGLLQAAYRPSDEISLPHVTEEAPPMLAGGEKQSRVGFNVREHAYKLTGTDLFRIRGLNSETVLRIVSEVGVDVSAFPTEKHFASWLCLSPNRRVSGGRELSSGTRASSNRAAAAFRQAAVSVERSRNELGAFYRRKRAQKGPASAATATAHKIARLYYSLVKNGSEYNEQGAVAYEEREKERTVSALRKRAKAYGYDLVAPLV